MHVYRVINKASGAEVYRYSAAAQITPIHSEVKNIEEVSDTILTDSRTLTTSKFTGLK